MPAPERHPVVRSPASIATAAEGEIVTVEVGPYRKRFLLHKALLSHHSEYFAGALRGQWQEAQTGVVLLLDIEPAVFRLFVHWLYTQQVPATFRADHWPAILELEDKFYSADAIFVVLIKAYVFADRFLAIHFRQEVSEAFHVHITDHAFNGTTQLLVVKHVFAHVPPERPILQLMVDDHCHCWHEDWDSPDDIQAQQKMPRSFSMRVTRRLSELYQSSSLEVKKERCHVDHALAQEKESCKLAHMVYDKIRDFGRYLDC